METIKTKSLLIITIFVVFVGINTYQTVRISELQTEVAKVKIEQSLQDYVEQDELERVQYAIVDLHNQMDAFIGVHDGNVDFMNEMRDTINNIIDYLN